jgi:hypothetical protein
MLFLCGFAIQFFEHMILIYNVQIQRSLELSRRVCLWQVHQQCARLHLLPRVLFSSSHRVPSYFFYNLMFRLSSVCYNGSVTLQRVSQDVKYSILL